MSSPIIGPNCHAQGITGYGHPEEGVMLVGIAPGADEMRTGRPMTGPSGQLVDAILKACGWNRDRVYVTNLLCWYKDDPSFEDVQACFPRLLGEIKAFRPKLVIPLGKTPIEHLTRVGGSSAGIKSGRVRGEVLWNDVLNCYTMGTYHPAAFLRGGVGFIHDIVRDFRKIPYLMGFPLDGKEGLYDFVVMESLEQAQVVLDDLPLDGRVVTLDVETDNKAVDAIDAWSDNLLSFAITTTRYDPNKGQDVEITWVFPHECAVGLDWSHAEQVPFTFQNGMFDTQVIRKSTQRGDGSGVWLRIKDDTMLKSYIVDERGGQHGLKHLAREYAFSGYYEVPRKAKRRMGDVPRDVELAYNAADAAYTRRIDRPLTMLLDEEDVRRPYENILIPATNALAQVTYRGAYISPQKLGLLALDWIPRLLSEEEGLQAQARELGWNGDINLNSPVQLAALMYDVIGLPYTDFGRTTRAEVLELLADEHPFAKRLATFRHLDHMVNTYIVGIQDDLKVDQRVHPDPLIHGTVTGRLSYHDPPIQTIPKEFTLGEDFGRIRTVFSATPAQVAHRQSKEYGFFSRQRGIDDEYEIAEADYQQAELRTAYAYSRDSQMLADLESGDFHANTAVSIFGKQLHEVTELDRYMTKFVTFGVLYGRGPHSLAKGQLKCAVYEAQRFLDKWFKRYSTHASWMREQKRQAMENGELVTITGRKRRFHLVLDDDFQALNQAVNFPVQSTSHDALLTSLVQLHQELARYDSYVLFEIHDAILFEISKRWRKEALCLIRDVMQRPRFPNWISMPVDVKVGPSWGEAKQICTRCLENGPNPIKKTKVGKLCVKCDAMKIQELTAAPALAG